MPDELTPQAGTSPGNAVGATPSSEVAEKPEKVFDAAYVKELRDEAAKWRKTVRDLEARISEFDTAKSQQEETKLKEEKQYEELLRKRDVEMAQLKADLERERTSALRLRIGFEAGLPTALISRLTGSTEDELKADALILKELFTANAAPPAAPVVAPDKTTAPVLPTEASTPQVVDPSRRQITAVAPDGQPTGETAEQKRMRLYNRSPIATPPIFNPTSR